MARRAYINRNPTIKTRAQAVAAGEFRYYTGEPCKNGHLSERSVSNGGCLDCMNPRRTMGDTRYPEQFIVLKVILPRRVAFEASFRNELQRMLETYAEQLISVHLASGGTLT